MINKEDLEMIVERSIKPLKDMCNEAEPEPERKESIDEAYVTSAKHYSQVSELVSQRAKDAHNELYQEYVTKLNEVSARVDAANKGNASGNNSDYRSLKLDEANLVNAVHLHELYFSNAFDPHSELFCDTLSYMRLQRDWGTFDDWQSDFIACALANRTGWAICGYNTFLKRFVNTFIDGHSSGVMLGLIPVIVIDMHEHAFFRDYLDDKRSYLIAMMREINWEIVEERFRKLEKVHEAIK